MNEHLERILEAADRVDAGETNDITDLTDEEYLAYIQKLATEAMETRTGKRETLEEMLAWVKGIEEPTCEERLEELLEEFETARLANKTLVRPLHATPDDVIEAINCVIHGEAKEVVDQILGENEEVLRPARRYIIARDFGEFNPERADMLWKLQSTQE